MGREGSPESQSNTVDKVEKAVLVGVTESGEEVFLEATEDGQTQVAQQAPNGARLTDLLASVEDDEARVRVFGTDDAGNLVEANLAALNDSPADGDIGQLTYLARALDSKGLDEFVSRVTDSTGAQVDPATQALEAALKSNDADEFVSRITDPTGTEVSPATVALEGALKSNDTDEFVSRVADPSGTEVDPLARRDTSPVTGSTTTNGTNVTLTLGDYRKDTDLFVDTSGAATLTVEVRAAGGTWREFDTVDYGSATVEVEQYSTSFAEVRARVDSNLNTLEASAKGV